MYSWIVKVLIFTCINLTVGLQLCSKSRAPVHCLPCSKSGTDVFRCPEGCVQDAELRACNTTCSDHCVDSKCGFDKTSTLICLQGCADSFTGPYCQEPCFDGCARCSQDNKCLQCQKGRFGEVCKRKCSTCRAGDCGVNGQCRSGCVDGYFGSLCKKKCSSRCGQCNFDTGQCIECVVGWFGQNCQSNCRNCRNKRCSLQDGVCIDGCESGYELQGTTCQKVPQGEQEDPEEQKMSGLASIFQEEDYLLPIVGCLLVLLLVVAAVVFWKCKKSFAKDKKKEENTEKDLEDGMCNGFPQKCNGFPQTCNGFSSHPSLKRVIAETPKGDPPYKEVVEEAIRTHSCEEILKKHNLLDPNRPSKSLGSLRNRTGNLSMPFMTPIEEDENEEEVEEEVGVHMPNVGIIFTLEPPEDETPDANVSLDIPIITVQDESGSSIDLPVTDRGGDFYILQRGMGGNGGGLSVPFDYMDTSISGRSTPRQPEMYSNNPHSEGKGFTTQLSVHLDTYLTHQPRLSEERAGDQIDATESDALLRQDPFENNNEPPLKVPKKTEFLSASYRPVPSDGVEDTAHVFFQSEREPMLSREADSNV